MHTGQTVFADEKWKTFQEKTNFTSLVAIFSIMLLKAVSKDLLGGAVRSHRRDNPFPREVWRKEVGLIVVGVNHEGSAVPVREKFWLSERRRYAMLRQLTHAAGIREAVMVATFKQTEFILFADDTDDLRGSAK